MLIAIPSKGRPGKVKSQRLIGGAGVVFVPDYEVASYIQAGVKPVIGVPASVRGITATRNWILDNTSEPRVVFIDDDAEKVAWVDMAEGFGTVRNLSAEAILREFERLFDLTEQAGFRVWGVATDGAMRSVYPYRPFLTRAYITASCMGILNHTGLRFDERYAVKEDYELCLRCVKEDGGVLAARYWFWRNKHWTNAGGCTDYRTREIEERCIALLMKEYPGMVARIPNKASPYSIQVTL